MGGIQNLIVVPSRELGSFKRFLEHSLAHHYRRLALFSGKKPGAHLKKPLNFLLVKMDTIFQLGKIEEREGRYEKERGIPPRCATPDYRRFVNLMYEYTYQPGGVRHEILPIRMRHL